MKLTKDQIKYLEALRPAHWDQLAGYLSDAEDSGEYYGSLFQFTRRHQELRLVVDTIRHDQRRRSRKPKEMQR